MVEMPEETKTTLVPHKTDISKCQNGTTFKNEEHFKPPADGGSRAWLVMLGSFFCNGILFGVINSYGVLYTEFLDNFQRMNVTNAPGKAGIAKVLFYFKILTLKYV